MRAFTFCLAFFAPGERRAVRDDFSNVFMHCRREVALLIPSVRCIELECNGMDAWSSYEASRDVRLVIQNV
jgi:hypothetical protein